MANTIIKNRENGYKSFMTKKGIKGEKINLSRLRMFGMFIDDF